MPLPPRDLSETQSRFASNAHDPALPIGTNLLLSSTSDVAVCLPHWGAVGGGSPRASLFTRVLSTARLTVVSH